MVSSFGAALDQRLGQRPTEPAIVEASLAQRTQQAAAQILPGVSPQTHEAGARRRAATESFVAGFGVVPLICASLAVTGALSVWALSHDPPAGSSSRTWASPGPEGAARFQE